MIRICNFALNVFGCTHQNYTVRYFMMTASMKKKFHLPYFYQWDDDVCLNARIEIQLST